MVIDRYLVPSHCGITHAQIMVGFQSPIVRIHHTPSGRIVMEVTSALIVRFELRLGCMVTIEATFPAGIVVILVD